MGSPAAVDIAFSNLSVHVIDQRTKQAKTLIHSVSGAARSGRLLAIMGASGAGKSTLLDVMSAQTGQSNGMQVEGRMLVNGKPHNKAMLRKASCYVQQSDVLLCSATVREAISTSAMLKLPSSMTRAEKEARVDTVLKELELEVCANTLIGDETMGLKGISGGQKRRVSVGIELVKDPAAIFLDEPTSGLDSEMALSCMEALCRLAHNGRTVVCTIHQPNSNITALFDDFMLLAFGHVVYCGPWDGAVEQFAQLGFLCPNYRNPTDYFLSVVRDPKAAESLWVLHEQVMSSTMQSEAVEEGEGATKPILSRWSMPCLRHDDVRTKSLAFQQQGDQQPGTATPGPQAALTLIEVASQAASTAVTAAGVGDVAGAQRASMMTQVPVLTLRKFKDWIRNPTMLTSELGQYLFFGLFVGAMYCGSFEDNTTRGASNRAACIWFSFAIMCFTPGHTTIINWSQERQLLKREVSQQMYSIQTYYAARVMVMLPFQAAQCLLFVAIMYFFAGFQVNASKFFLYFLTLLLFQLVSEGLGMLSAIGTRSVTSATVVLTFAMLLLLSFSGFLVTHIPIYFRWLNDVSYLTYAYAALMESEFDGLTLTTPDGAQVSGMSVVATSALTQFGVWGNISVLAAQVGGMELLKLGALYLAYRLNML